MLDADKRYRIKYTWQSPTARRDNRPPMTRYLYGSDNSLQWSAEQSSTFSAADAVELLREYPHSQAEPA